MPSSLVTNMRMNTSLSSPACGGGRRASLAGWGSTLRNAPSPTLPRERGREKNVLWVDAFSLLGSNHLDAAHIRLQHVRHRDRAIGLLIILHHRNQRAADGHARAVERVDVTHVPALFGAITRAHPARLKFPAHRARGNLAEHVLPGQPDFDVIGLLRGKA